MMTQSVNETHNEILHLREQLAAATRLGRTPSDGRLQMLLKTKLRHLEADIARWNREVVRSISEQNERHTRTR